MQKNIKMRGKEVETFALGSFSFRNIFSLFAKKKDRKSCKKAYFDLHSTTILK